MIVTEETKAHAQDIFDYLIMNPEKHDQSDWYNFYNEEDVLVTEENFCGTTMCVAGTSVWLKSGVSGLNNKYDYEFLNEGAKNLGLAYNEACTLFYGTNNEESLSLLAAVAAGDEDKFYDIAREVDKIYIDGADNPIDWSASQEI